MMGRALGLEMGFNNGAFLASIVDAGSGKPDADQGRAHGDRCKTYRQGGGGCSAGHMARVVVPFVVQLVDSHLVAFGGEFLVVKRHGCVLSLGMRAYIYWRSEIK